MNDNFYTLQQVLEIIRYELIGASANVVWVGQSIFAIGAMLYLTKLSYEGMLGSSLFSTKLLRVFGIAILLVYPLHLYRCYQVPFHSCVILVFSRNIFFPS